MSKLSDIFGPAAPETVLNKPSMHLAFYGVPTEPNATGWQDRNLNTVVGNGIPGAVLADNVVTLPAGEYYATCSAYSYKGGYSFVAIRTTANVELMVGQLVYARNTADFHGLAVPGEGPFTLTIATSIKLSMSASSVKESGSDVGAAHSVLNIWKLDSQIKTPVLQNTGLFPLPGNTMVTGNMVGLEYARTGDHEITVQPGLCMDALNSTLLSLATQAVVTVPTVINEVYNLFLCDDGVVRTDTDVNGAALSAYKIRWIGFVRNNASGVLCLFWMNGSTIIMGKKSENTIAGLTTTYAQYDHSIVLPVSRIELIQYGTRGSSPTSGNAVSSLDGVNTEHYLGSNLSANDADTSTAAWGSASYQLGGMIPFSIERYFKEVTDNAVILVKQIKIRR